MTTRLLLVLSFFFALGFAQQQAGWKLLDYDDFNRGTLGTNYTLPGPAFGVGTPFLFNNQLCATTQSIFIRSFDYTGADYIRFTFAVNSNSTEGFEFYSMVNTTVGYINGGCDGGYGNCFTVINNLGSNTRLVNGSLLNLLPNTNYYFRATYSVGPNFPTKKMTVGVYASLTDENPIAPAISTTVTLVPNQFIFIIGRGGVTCIDGFTAELGYSLSLMAGCDGGFGNGGICGTRIADIYGAQVTMTTTTVYQMEVVIKEPQVNLTVRNSASTVLATLSGFTTSTMDKIGLLVGRNADNQFTCGDNLAIQNSTDGVTWNTLFSDNFDRPNGPLGSNYTVITSLPSAVIYNNQVCADTQVVSIWAGTISGTYKRMTWTFQSFANPGFETYAIGISSNFFIPSAPSGTVMGITLNANYANVVGGSGFPQFADQFQRDITTATGAEPGQVQLLSMMPGSVIVNFKFVDSKLSGNQLATRLQNLYSAGNITSIAGLPITSVTPGGVSTTGAATVTTGAIATGIAPTTSNSTVTSGANSIVLGFMILSVILYLVL